MPSPRSSPAIRPSSPLSPRYEAARFEPLQPPSPRNIHARPSGNTSRRANTNRLRLPSLPRFHPANYPSAHSSMQPTPDSNASPQPSPLSPGSHRRLYSDAQKQLFVYQRETIAAACASSPARTENPVSPRLAPLGSPGPVTPLQLEAAEGYLVAGAKNAGKSGAGCDELVEKLIREQTGQRRGSRSPGSR